MRFLFPSTVAVTVLIAIGAIGSKAEAAMRPGIGTPPAHTKNYTPVEDGWLATILSPGLLRLWLPLLWVRLCPALLRLWLPAIRLLWLWASLGLLTYRNARSYRGLNRCRQPRLATLAGVTSLAAVYQR